MPAKQEILSNEEILKQQNDKAEYRKSMARPEKTYYEVTDVYFTPSKSGILSGHRVKIQRCQLFDTGQIKRSFIGSRARTNTGQWVFMNLFSADDQAGLVAGKHFALKDFSQVWHGGKL